MHDGAAALNTAARKKIYVRETQGRYTSLRWACVWGTQLVFYGLPWLSWNGRQSVLFDVAAGKLFLFGLVLWPQDFIYLAAALIFGALALFLSSAIAGRVWCGFACPHTVYTEIFMWIERKIEGGRSARMRLDREVLSIAKLAKKVFKHGAWIALAAWTGLTFAGYFTPVRVLAGAVAELAAGPWEWFWISFYGLLTYCNAGWMREQVCRYVCPHARFQSAMADRDTLAIAYDAGRGEPRGLRNRKRATARQGDCVDCTLCVQVCPTGIDIRQGFQYDCMGCAACIDACNLVMDKIGAARGLIRYGTGSAPPRWRSRPRVLMYAVSLAAITAVAVACLLARAPLRLDVMLDRGVLLREVEGGMIENVYRLRMTNRDERAHRYRIAVSGVFAVATPDRVALGSGATVTVPLRLRAAPGQGRAGSNAIVFEVKDSADDTPGATEKAVFLMPGYPVPGGRPAPAF